MRRRQLKRGQRIRVPYGAGTHNATVIDVRDGRIYVAIDVGDAESAPPVETFYRRNELAGV